MKKDCEKTIEDVSNMKNKYNNINEKMKDINKALSGNISFEQIQEDILFRVKVNQKIDDFEQKFRVVLGDYDADDNEIEDKKRNKIKFLTNDREKNKSILKKNKNDKLFNLIEINKRINQYQNSKVSISDYETKNEENKKYIDKLEKKIDNLSSILYGHNDSEKEKTGENNNNNYLFPTKNEFENYKKKTDKEIDKIWDKIEDLNKQYEDLFNQLKDKSTLNDLDSMKNLILEKTEELFLAMKNKNKISDNRSLEILQNNFKKLLELLAEKEDEDKWSITKRSLGNYACASCENFLGKLKDDSDKYIHWKKLPLKEKLVDNNGTRRLYKIGNGYSRLLKMINFDNNGIPLLNPFEKMNEYVNTSTSNENSKRKDTKKNFNKSDYKNGGAADGLSKDNRKTTIHIIKKRNKLPDIKVTNSTDHFENVKKMNNSTSSFNFMSPKFTRNMRKSYYKFDL